MVEHMEYYFNLAANKIVQEVDTPEPLREKYLEFLWNYKPIPKHFNYPTLRKGETEDLQHESLEAAINAMLEAYEAYQKYFDENPDAKSVNAVYGSMDKMHWMLLTRKHVDHHFRQFGLID
jgi:oxepin-CoA hydrolase/3-oxo-5,6-dehydrosuberyl-CoA semialdehyde dehydrogenase